MDLMQEMVASSVISWSIGVVVELSAIAKIRKCRGPREGHHFILLAMEVHDTPMCDMDRLCLSFPW
jgi:hypothetical protein